MVETSPLYWTAKTMGNKYKGMEEKQTKDRKENHKEMEERRRKTRGEEELDGEERKINRSINGRKYV